MPGNKFKIVTEDLQAVALTRDRVQVRMLLRKGALLSTSRQGLRNDNEFMFAYNEPTGVHIIGEYLPYIKDIEQFNNEYSSNILDDRDDYRIRWTTGEECNIICCNKKHIERLISTKKSSNIRVKDGVDTRILFKYIPVSTYNQSGFIVDNKWIVSVDKKGAIKYEETPISITSNNKFIDLSVLIDQCEFRVINYIDSAKMFKFTEAKKALVGKIVKVSNIGIGDVVKKVDIPQNTIHVVNEEGRNLRFLLSDIEIIYPNISSFNPPKDRIVKKGSIVKVVNDKRISIPKNERVKVLDIKVLGNHKWSKKYAIIEYQGKKIYSKTKDLKVC